MIYNILNRTKLLPKASQVLECYLRQENYPLWTSYFVKYKTVVNDQFIKSYFIFNVDEKHNYLILRTGCFPYIKYHCTKTTLIDDKFYQGNSFKYQNTFFNCIKVLNLGNFLAFLHN
jgi:hypothetical protein